MSSIWLRRFKLRIWLRMSAHGSCAIAHEVLPDAQLRMAHARLRMASLKNSQKVRNQNKTYFQYWDMTLFSCSLLKSHHIKHHNSLSKISDGMRDCACMRNCAWHARLRMAHAQSRIPMRNCAWHAQFETSDLNCWDPVFGGVRNRIRVQTDQKEVLFCPIWLILTRIWRTQE